MQKMTNTCYNMQLHTIRGIGQYLPEYAITTFIRRIANAILHRVCLGNHPTYGRAHEAKDPAHRSGNVH